MYQELNMRFKQPLIVNTNYWFTLILEHQLIKRETINSGIDRPGNYYNQIRSNTLSDAGYTSGDQLQACKYSGICTYSSPMPSTSPNSNSIPLAEFHYINDGDYYICPCGEQMTTTGKWRIRPNYRSKVYKTSACVKLLNKRKMYSKSKWQSNRKK